MIQRDDDPMIRGLALRSLCSLRLNIWWENVGSNKVNARGHPFPFPENVWGGPGRSLYFHLKNLLD